MNIFMMIIISISLFFLAYGWFLYCCQPAVKNTISEKLFKLPAVPFLVLGGISCVIMYFLFPKQIDSLIFLPLENILVFFISGFCVLGLLNRFKSNTSQFIIILLFSLLNTFLLPQNFALTDGLLPIWSERIILALCWSCFALLYFILNGVEGILSIQSLSVCFGVMLLFAVGIMPILYGSFSCIFIALFLALTFYTSYPTQISFSITECRFLGYLIGWLGILTTIEGNGSCFVILNMYYIYELVIALGKRISFQKQFKLLVNNTFYSQLANVGISPRNICNLISRINLVMILLAGFQIYSPNSYTVIIVSFFMVFWISSKITSPEEHNNRLLLTSSLISFLKKNKTTKDDEQ